jgi:hypothetical protein
VGAVSWLAVDPLNTLTSERTVEALHEVHS